MAGPIFTILELFTGRGSPSPNCFLVDAQAALCMRSGCIRSVCDHLRSQTFRIDAAASPTITAAPAAYSPSFDAPAPQYKPPPWPGDSRRSSCQPARANAPFHALQKCPPCVVVSDTSPPLSLPPLLLPSSPTPPLSTPPSSPTLPLLLPPLALPKSTPLLPLPALQLVAASPRRAALHWLADAAAWSSAAEQLAAEHQLTGLQLAALPRAAPPPLQPSSQRHVPLIAPSLSAPQPTPPLPLVTPPLLHSSPLQSPPQPLPQPPLLLLSLPSLPSSLPPPSLSRRAPLAARGSAAASSTEHPPRPTHSHLRSCEACTYRRLIPMMSIPIKPTAN